MVNYANMYDPTNKSDYASDYTPVEQVSISQIDEDPIVSEEQIVENAMHTGTVANCDAAYIRESPTKASNHIAIVKKGEELIIEDTAHTNWYKATTQNGVDGYIMRELVSLD